MARQLWAFRVRRTLLQMHLSWAIASGLGLTITLSARMSLSGSAFSSVGFTSASPGAAIFPLLLASW